MVKVTLKQLLSKVEWCDRETRTIGINGIGTSESSWLKRELDKY